MLIWTGWWGYAATGSEMQGRQGHWQGPGSEVGFAAGQATCWTAEAGCWAVELPRAATVSGVCRGWAPGGLHLQPRRVLAHRRRLRLHRVGPDQRPALRKGTSHKGILQERQVATAGARGLRCLFPLRGPGHHLCMAEGPTCVTASVSAVSSASLKSRSWVTGSPERPNKHVEQLRL